MNVYTNVKDKEKYKKDLITNTLLILEWIKTEIPNHNDTLELRNKLKTIKTTLKVKPELILKGKILSYTSICS